MAIYIDILSRLNIRNICIYIQSFFNLVCNAIGLLAKQIDDMCFLHFLFSPRTQIDRCMVSGKNTSPMELPSITAEQGGDQSGGRIDYSALLPQNCDYRSQSLYMAMSSTVHFLVILHQNALWIFSISPRAQIHLLHLVRKKKITHMHCNGSRIRGV